MAQTIPRTLNRQDYKTLSLAALGGALEFYDFIIFIFFAVTIGKLFFPPDIPAWLVQMQTFGIFAAGYLVRPLGGIVMAHFGDLVGRKKMFSLSILLMAVPTLCIGLLPTYESIGIAAPLLLLLMRVMQGAAIGGEVPGAWVFVSEHVPKHRIGIACGTLTAGLTVGILLGSLVAMMMATLFTEARQLAWGWRVPFFLGGIFGFVALYLRRWLAETPIFQEMKQQKALAKELPLKTVVVNHKEAIVISMLLTWLLSAGVVVVILLTPAYLQTEFGLAKAVVSVANMTAILALCGGCLVAGYLCDKLGASVVFTFGSLLLAVCTGYFYLTAGEPGTPLSLTYGLAGFSVGVVGAVPFVMVNSYPAEIRFSGISFSYNLSYAIFGGLTPVVVTLFLKWTPLAPAYYMLGLSLIGLLLGLYMGKAAVRQRMMVFSS